MAAALKAGFLYFAIVFAAGFAFGVLRVAMLVPQIGESAALLVELPAMLALCWIVCGAIVTRLAVPPLWSARFAMGAFAFVLLMVAEAGAAVLVAGRSLAEHWAGYCNAGTQIGLLAQLAFAAFPLILARLRRS